MMRTLPLSALALAALLGGSACESSCPDDLCAEVPVDAVSLSQVASSDATSAATFVTTGAGDAVLAISGGTCTEGRCTAPTSGSGPLSVDLVVESHGRAQQPVLARWSGCGTAQTTFWTQWIEEEYVVHYTTTFTDVAPGSTCTAELVQGSWMTFAGNLSTEATTGTPYCSARGTSEREGLVLDCFVPADEPLVIESDLAGWQCVTVDEDGKATVGDWTRGPVRLASPGNQIVSCMGAARLP